MKYTRVEFAKRLGKGNNYVGQYLNRGKLMLDDGLIDDENEVNAAFLARFESKRGGVVEANPEPRVVASASKPRATKEPASSPTKVGATKQAEPGSLLALDQRKKELDIRKTEAEEKLLRIKIEKLQGILIPTDAVMMLFAQHFKSVYVAFENAADNMLTEIAQKTKMSSKDQAAFRGKLIESINHAVKDAVDRSEKDLGHIVSEFSDTRGRGERK
jgi:hypothetical protein